MQQNFRAGMAVARGMMVVEMDAVIFTENIEFYDYYITVRQAVQWIIDKSLLQVGTGAILCMAKRLSSFERDNLIVPIAMI